MSARSHVAVTFACAAVAAVAPCRVVAQAPARGPAPLSLADAVTVALTDNSSVRISAHGVDVGRSIALAGAAAFDAQIQTTVTRQSQNALQYVVKPTATDLLTTTTNQLGYGVSWQRRLRNGMVVSPQVGVTSVDVPGQYETPQGRASLALGVLMPLTRDRNGIISRSTEESGIASFDASVSDLRYAASSGVRQAASAYWSYVAARQQLAIYTESEERASRLLVQTEALVKADERPATDLVQLRGNVAAKRAARIGAEESVATAWEQLAITMALPIASVETPPPTATALPTPGAADSTSTSATLVQDALARRADLAAATRRTEAARLSSRAAGNAQRAPFNLSVQVGYAGLQQGNALNNLYGPIYRNASHLNTNVQLSYALPTSNLAARGTALQADAAFEQQMIAQRDVERRVGMGVTIAAQALRRSRLQLADAHVAVTLADETVRNERRKFQLGSSTVFDVLLAEDNVTNAELSELNGKLTYAVALATVRFEMGTLVQGEGTQLTVDPTVLLTAP